MLLVFSGYCPGLESFLIQKPYILSGVASIQWVLNAKNPMGFSAEWVILKGLIMSLLWGQLKPGFSVYPILYPFLPIHRLRSWMCLNELHACWFPTQNYLPKETEAQYLPNRRGLNLKMSIPTPQRQALEKEMTLTGMWLWSEHVSLIN